MEMEKKKIEFQREPKKRRFNGFPIWVWLLLLAIVVGVYLVLSMRGA